MARKLDLKGMSKDMLPKLADVWREGWANIIPLLALLAVLFSGYTPFMSAFCGISMAVIAGMSRMREPQSMIYSVAFITFVIWKYFNGGFELPMSIFLIAGSVIATFNPQQRIKIPEMAAAMELGVKYALAVGAASAAVGIVVGVINTTGIGFRIGFMVTSAAGSMASDIHNLVSYGAFELVAVEDLQLFLSLVFIAVACILMGAGTVSYTHLTLPTICSV